MMARIPNTITQRNKALHAQQRRHLSHGFSEAALRVYEEPIETHIRNFYHHLLHGEEDESPQDQSIAEGQWTRPKNMAHWCK